MYLIEDIDFYAPKPCDRCGESHHEGYDVCPDCDDAPPIILLTKLNGKF